MRTCFKAVLISSALCVAASSFALQAPTQFVSSLVSNLKQDVATKHVSLTTNPDKLYAVVKNTVMPEIDIEEMAGMALGPRWRSATDAQRTAFVNEFSKLVTRNYSSALLKISDYDFVVYPIRGNGWEKASSVAVHGVIKPNSGGQGSSVTYYLEKSGDNWKIYDFAVEGVSFVNNYRSQFASYHNVSDLIDALKKLNARKS